MTEAAVKKDVGHPMERVGSLSAVPIAEVVRKIAREGKSGDLQVIFGRTIKTLYFDRGFIVFSASNLKSDRLGESLIEFGRISRHEFAMASMLMKTSKRKFGQVLVDSGLMSEEELGRQVALVVNKIVLSLFKESEGIYSFDERPCIIPMSLMVSLSVYRILLEGIRRMSSGRLILAGLPPVTSSVRVSEQPPFTFEFDNLKPIEQAVLRAAGKGAKLESIVKRVRADRGRVLRAGYGLYAAGVIEQVGIVGASKPLRVQEETGVFLLSDIERKFAAVRAGNTQQEVLMEFDRLTTSSDAELLKVDRRASLADVKAAFEARRREWVQRRSVIENDRSLSRKVDEIQARLEAAFRKMETERLEPEAPPPRLARGDDKWIVESPTEPEHRAVRDVPQKPAREPKAGATRNAERADPLAASRAQQPKEAPPAEAAREGSESPSRTFDDPLAEAQRSETPAAESAPRKATRKGGREDADSPPTVFLPPPGGEELLDELGIQMESTPPSTSEYSRPTSDETAAATVDDLDRLPRPETDLTKEQRYEKTRQLYRDVQLHFQVRDYEGAISLLYELIKLSPSNAAYHGLLAKAMLKHPVMRKNAERHFVEALRLDPENADLHFSLGVYYKAFGFHSRAITQFRTALRINPRHEKAKKHLSTEGKKDSIKDMFRKIFGS